jgi:hypothetical protein
MTESEAADDLFIFCKFIDALRWRSDENPQKIWECFCENTDLKKRTVASWKRFVKERRVKADYLHRRTGIIGT